MASFKAWVSDFEQSKLGQQVFRFLRLFVFAVATGVLVAGAPFTWSLLAGVVVGAAETAFRTVWPVVAVPKVGPDPVPVPDVPAPDPTPLPTPAPVPSTPTAPDSTSLDTPAP